MSESGVPLENIYDALPAKCQKVLADVRSIARTVKVDHVHLTASQYADLTQAIAKVREHDKVGRPVEMRYAGVELVCWSDPLAESS